jgi:hypothetical protein
MLSHHANPIQHANKQPEHNNINRKQHSNNQPLQYNRRVQQANNQLMQHNTRVHQVQENTSVQHTNNQSAQDKTSQQDLKWDWHVVRRYFYLLVGCKHVGDCCRSQVGYLHAYQLMD